MIACVDVHYEESGARAAYLAFDTWSAPEPSDTAVTEIDEVAEYQPGEFYRRELPCLLTLLGEADDELDSIVVDGYVWLSDDGRPGLGAHLWDELSREVAVVGVAKNPFRGSGFAERVLRGDSSRPLYVTAAGMDAERAAEHVRSMHGEYRVPTLLRRVDHLCRGL